MSKEQEHFLADSCEEVNLQIEGKASLGALAFSPPCHAFRRRCRSAHSYLPHKQQLLHM